MAASGTNALIPRIRKAASETNALIRRIGTATFGTNAVNPGIRTATSGTNAAIPNLGKRALRSAAAVPESGLGARETLAPVPCLGECPFSGNRSGSEINPGKRKGRASNQEKRSWNRGPRRLRGIFHTRGQSLPPSAPAGFRLAPKSRYSSPTRRRDSFLAARCDLSASIRSFATRLRRRFWRRIFATRARSASARPFWRASILSRRS